MEGARLIDDLIAKLILKTLINMSNKINKFQSCVRELQLSSLAASGWLVDLKLPPHLATGFITPPGNTQG